MDSWALLCCCMAVASGPAGLVLTGPIAFGIVHAQKY